MARAIASAARQMARELDDEGDPGFLMVVQENEDNLFDQRLLERRLQGFGTANLPPHISTTAPAVVNRAKSMSAIRGLRYRTCRVFAGRLPVSRLHR